MRLLFSILLFTAFALRPAMEISTVLYYQLNIDYIVENYCVNKERPALKCDGKCYLTKQMQSINNSSDTEKEESVVIFESFIPLFYQEISVFGMTNTFYIDDEIPNWFFRDDITLDVLHEIDHPPQII